MAYSSFVTDPDIDAATGHFKAFLRALGLDPAVDPHLEDTPRRVAEMYADALGGGEEFSMTTFPAEGADQMIIVGSIPFTSFCAHHLLPFTGFADVAYIPSDTIAGLSKFARVVRTFAARPQVQERLTEEIANYLADVLKPQGLAISIDARHACMEARGVKAHGAITRTTVLRGKLKDNEQARQEYFAALNNQRA